MLFRTISPAFGPVSRLSLGSWNTFSRLAPDGLDKLLRSATTRGINFFDIGYYWDKPDTQQAFGESLARLGLNRSELIISEKLWLWDYPAESFADQLKRSLTRLGLTETDMVMVSRPTPDVDFAAFCKEIVGLIQAGLTKAWGVTNWSAEQIEAARVRCLARGWPMPVMVQLQYNPMRQGVVESGAFDGLFESGAIALWPSFILEGGIISGHLGRDRVDPEAFHSGTKPLDRNIARDSGGVREDVRRLQPRLAEIAREFGATPSQAAIAFCLSHPAAASALVGVTSVENLTENLGALDLLTRGEQLRAAMRELALKSAPPKLFNPHNDP